MDIGIFSGSFNPVHIGHLALANYLCEYEGLDEVWFMVTPHNPLKEEASLMSDEFRLKLVQLAIGINVRIQINRQLGQRYHITQFPDITFPRLLFEGFEKSGCYFRNGTCQPNGEVLYKGFCKRNIETFHAAQRFESKRVETQPGVTCWQKAVTFW